MAKSGESIVNPLTGEELTFLKTAADTGGKQVEMTMRVRPGGFAATEHIHLGQEERFTVRYGQILLSVNGAERVLAEGESAAIPPGTPHVWSNRGKDEALVAIEFCPAGNVEGLFENLFGLARDGKTNARGEPNLLQCSVMSPEYGLYMAKPPVPVQRTIFTVVRPLARALGYRSHYPQYGSAESR